MNTINNLIRQAMSLPLLIVLAIILISLSGVLCAALFFVLCYVVTKELFINRPL